jgi:CRP/FNR family transcriptional regulator, cyclic AMP receptor protein
MDPGELSSVGLFSSLSKSELARLAAWTDELSFPAGMALAREGAFAHEFFVIEEGTVAVLRDGERLTELGPGDFFGEIGLLETERRTASVVTTEPVRAIVMFQREFRQMEKEMPAVAEQIRAAIRDRIAR